MSKSLLDLMPEAEREKALIRAEKRLDKQRARRGLDVSPEIFLVSEMGYYFGWEAMMAVRRNYTIEPVTGEKEVFTLAEAQLLLEGARKVWYSKLIEQSHVGMVSNSFNTSSKTYDAAIQPFTDRAKVEE